MSRTVTILKPDAIQEGYVGKILDMIIQSGFRIIAMKMIFLTVKQSKEFYKVHSEKKFFEELIGYMTSGSVIVALLEKDNAVDDFRNLIGSTDPLEAEEGTIRKLFAKDRGVNTIHGSDNQENAEVEQNFFFPRVETI